MFIIISGVIIVDVVEVKQCFVLKCFLREPSFERGSAQIPNTYLYLCCLLLVQNRFLRFRIAASFRFLRCFYNLSHKP
jgi:hypothetical protein